MNERINELHEQAHSYACEYARRPDYNPHNPYNEGMYKERYVSKFAELIVQECIAQCEKNKDHEWLGSGSKLSAFNIREHFGVE